MLGNYFPEIIDEMRNIFEKNAITNNDLSIIWSVFYTQRADEGWNWNRKTLIALNMNLGEKLGLC